jgi:hypothetical protein
MMTIKPFFATLIVFAALAGCNGVPQQAQPATATLAPIVSMTPRFTATPVSSPTPLPTFTMTPSESPVPPTPSDTPTPTDVPPLLGIISSTQRVNLREGPGTSYGAVVALDPGTGVTVLSLSSDQLWYQIQTEDGTVGWLSSKLLFLKATVTPPPSLTPPPDLTALAQGTPLPTSILGGGTVTPTPPLSAVSPTPVANATIPLEGTINPGVPVINVDSFNQTATALVSSITGGATGTAQNQPAGGPTGGPVGIIPTATLVSGQATQSAAQRPDVLAYCDDKSYGIAAPGNLAAGTSIDVYWSWYAKTEDLIGQHNDNASYEVSVDGTRLTDWREYASPVRLQSDNRYYQYWYVPYGPLTSGKHVISYRVTWKTAISDGYQQYGPGTPNIEETGSCTFTVK